MKKLCMLCLTLLALLAVQVQAGVETFNDFTIVEGPQGDPMLYYQDALDLGYDSPPGGWIFTADDFGFTIAPTGGPDGSACITRDGNGTQYSRGFGYVIKDNFQTKGVQTIEFDLLYNTVTPGGDGDVAMKVFGINPDPAGGAWVATAGLDGNGGSGNFGVDYACRYREDAQGGGGDVAADGTQLLFVVNRDGDFTPSAEWTRYSFEVDFGTGHEWIAITIGHCFQNGGNGVADPLSTFCLDNFSFATVAGGGGAINPDPDDGEQNIPSPYTLNWEFDTKAAKELQGFTLYLDTDEDLVREPNLPTQPMLIDGEAIAAVATADPNLFTGSKLYSPIEMGETYFWRVDSHVLDPNYEAGQPDPNIPVFNIPNTIKGATWSFTGIIPVPVITLQPVNQYVVPDKNFLQLPTTETREFVVEIAHGLPLTEVTWYKDGSPVVEDADHVVTTTPAVGTAATQTETKLTISNVSEADDALYYVIAKISDETAQSDTVGLYVSSELLVHRWSFNGNLIDSVGGADAVIRDPNAPGNITLTSSEVVFDPTFDAANSADPNVHWVDLPNNLISALGNNMTIMAWYTNDVDLAWARVFDFGMNNSGEEDTSGSAGDADYIYFTPKRGTSSFLRFHGKIGGQDQNVEADILPAGQEVAMTATWNNDTNQMNLYIDGDLQDTGDLPAAPLSDLDDRNMYLGRSQWPDALFDGSINELRIYNVALSDGWVKALVAEGPDGDPLVADPCLADFAPAAQYDQNGDCVVDLADFAIFAAKWLECGTAKCLYPASLYVP